MSSNNPGSGGGGVSGRSPFPHHPRPRTRAVAARLSLEGDASLLMETSVATQHSPFAGLLRFSPLHNTGAVAGVSPYNRSRGGGGGPQRPQRFFDSHPPAATTAAAANTTMEGVTNAPKSATSVNNATTTSFIQDVAEPGIVKDGISFRIEGGGTQVADLRDHERGHCGWMATRPCPSLLSPAMGAATVIGCTCTPTT